MKFWVTYAAGVLFVLGIVLSAIALTRRWIGRRESAAWPTAELPTRLPLIQNIEEFADRLRDMLDGRFATSPGPKVGLAALMTTHRVEFDASRHARTEHDRHTLAIYFEQFRTPGVSLFKEAVELWWSGNPKLRPLVEQPQTAADLHKVEAVFRGLAHNLREKETDKAMEARGFVKRYVPVEPT